MKRWLGGLLVVILLFLAAYFVYRLPPVYARLGWRVESLRTRVIYTLRPPEQAVFVPRSVAGVPANLPEPAVRTTRTVPVETEAPTEAPAVPAGSPTAEPAAPTPTFTPGPTATPLPGRAVLNGVVHEYQQMNNCGPATLSMALSYWGWQGNQTNTRAVLRPNFATVDDKNVNMDEMVAYVQSFTGLQAAARAGGDLATLKALIAAGFPVMIEKGFQPAGEDWMGHYELLSGYDDAYQVFYAQDAYIMADLPVPYADLSERWWRDFNHQFLVVYPPEREAELQAALGAYADPLYGYTYGAEQARQETAALSGRDAYFAWFNLGSNRVALGDYEGAAAAYDNAFVLYSHLPEAERPWRMLWYQSGPYQAYYQTGRYDDVLALGNQTLATVGRPILEESFYWLGMARAATGDLEKAIEDFRAAVAINPDSTLARQELMRLGAEP